MELPCWDFGPTPFFFFFFKIVFALSLVLVLPLCICFFQACCWLLFLLFVLLLSVCFLIYTENACGTVSHKKAGKVFQDRSCDLCCLYVSIQYKSTVLSYERKQWLLNIVCITIAKRLMTYRSKTKHNLVWSDLICLSVCLSVCLDACLSVCRSAFLPVFLSFCLSFCLPDLVIIGCLGVVRLCPRLSVALVGDVSSNGTDGGAVCPTSGEREWTWFISRLSVHA